jgi:hypothetical protein
MMTEWTFWHVIDVETYRLIACAEEGKRTRQSVVAAFVNIADFLLGWHSNRERANFVPVAYRKGTGEMNNTRPPP